MKPAKYLTKRGKEYFYEISEYLKDKTSEIDSIELSMLCQAFAMHEDAVNLGNENGFINTFDNGTIQVNGYQTIIDKSYATILKHSPKFGLNPVDREKIFGKAKEKKTKKFA